MKTALYLIPALVFAVLFLIRAQFLKKRQLIYIIKPVSTFIVIGAVLLSFLEPTHNVVYTAGILLGLFFSLGGDIALMLKENRKVFFTGLVLFLIAHIVYTIVFIFLGSFSAEDMLSAMFLIITGICVYKLIRHKLKSLKGPIIGYMLIISVMVSRAHSAMNSSVFSYEQALMIASGALLFYFSDVILALNRFSSPWEYHYISLVFYYSGQFLLGLAASYF